MDIKEMIIKMYLKGYSIDYIKQLVYRRMNKSYFNDFFYKGIVKRDNYTYMEDCRNLVEKTILEHSTKDVVL